MFLKSVKIRLFHLWFLLKRPMTLGVRILVENDRREVLLVRHTYVDGWHLPGGGIEVGENSHQAAEKELREETAIVSKGEFSLIGVYYNRNASRRDHVILYRCDQWEDPDGFSPNREIAEIDFFPVDTLPVGITPGTRRRIEEVYFDGQKSRNW